MSETAEIRLRVRVRPGSSRVSVGGAYGPDEALVVAVTAAPVDGAATSAVLAAVAKALDIRTSRIRLATGRTARTKVLAITTDGDEGVLRARLAELLATPPRPTPPRP